MHCRACIAHLAEAQRPIPLPCPIGIGISVQTSNRRQTTKGWEICVSWKDGSSSWHPLADVKNSFPVQMAKYAISDNIDHLPAFVWWVKHTIKKEKFLIKVIKSKCSQRSHKFGFYVPKTVQEALEIDRQTNTVY
jgi:hypothetical protein